MPSNTRRRYHAISAGPPFTIDAGGSVLGEHRRSKRSLVSFLTHRLDLHAGSPDAYRATARLDATVGELGSRAVARRAVHLPDLLGKLTKLGSSIASELRGEGGNGTSQRREEERPVGD
ncbi:MAG: hypothetical protein U0R50_16150 [Gaiellales bacterium]